MIALLADNNVTGHLMILRRLTVHSVMEKPMSARIIERGRGPEIEGTRITVFRILDFIRAGDPPQAMMEQLRITPEQVEAALSYIAAHRQQLDAEYEQILERDRRGNPPWVEAGRAERIEELKQRVMRRQRNGACGE